MENPKTLHPLSIDQILHYFDKLKPQNNIELSVENAWKQKVKFLDEVAVQNNVILFLYNPYTNRFLYMSDKLMVLSGLDHDLFTAEDGVAYSMTRMHPSQLDAVLKMQQLYLDNYLKQKLFDYQSTGMCLNYLFKNAEGKFMQVLQRAIILEIDEQGNPALVLNFIHYVGHIKKYDSLGCVISSSEGISLYEYDFDQERIGPQTTFSIQERKIINLLGDGFNTKRIAETLFISPHTVDTHRRNLIRKTNCIDSTSVVAFAKLINLI